MVHFTTLTFLSLLSTAFASTGSISGTGSLPPYPTISAPYPISNSTITTSTCPPPITVTVTNSITVTTTVATTTRSPTHFPTGTGTGGTAAPTGTATAGYGYPYYRRGLEMRGLSYREEAKEKRSSWWSWW